VSMVNVGYLWPQKSIVMPAKAGIQHGERERKEKDWIPAYAGMTEGAFNLFLTKLNQIEFTAITSIKEIRR
jgi:hypothetical protein